MYCIVQHPYDMSFYFLTICVKCFVLYNTTQRTKPNQTKPLFIYHLLTLYYTPYAINSCPCNTLFRCHNRMNIPQNCLYDQACEKTWSYYTTNSSQTNVSPCALKKGVSMRKYNVVNYTTSS